MKIHNGKINVQIFSGGVDRELINFNDIKEKLDNLYQHFHINAVIMGWSVNKELYRNLKSYLVDKNTKLFLWFPVFSEMGCFEKLQPVIDYKGYEIGRYNLQEDESFEFYCPANDENIKSILNIFNNVYEDACFDGIFLDKIRYPSFANGKEAIFTCFCPKCEDKMREYGIDTARLKEKMEAIITGKEGLNQETNPLSINAYNALEYSFEDNILDEFFKFRSMAVYESIDKLYKFFKGKGLVVGLDVFAPVLGYFVGQDIKLLGKCGDFLKPMYYRKTMAPAGLPFELDMYARNFSFENDDLYINIKRRILETLKLSSEDESVFPVEFATLEMDELKRYGCEAQLHPGFEINRKDEIAPIFPDYVRDSMAMLDVGAVAGITLSWDIMSAPQDNFNEIFKYLEKHTPGGEK